MVEQQNFKFGTTWTKVKNRVILSLASTVLLGAASIAWTDRTNTLGKIDQIAASQKSLESDARVTNATVAAKLESVGEKVQTIDEKIDRNHAEAREDSRQIINLLTRRVAREGGP